MANAPNQNKSSEKVIAGVTGAGSGTLIVMLANNLPEASPWKSWLVIMAPSVSVLSGAIYQWIKAKISDYFQQKDLSSAIDQARKTLETALNNQATTAEHKKELQKNLEKLEKLEAAARMKKVEALAGANA